MRNKHSMPLSETNALPPSNPTLYFSGWGYDERNDQSSQDKGANVQVVTTAGQSFVLRKIRDYIFFRRCGETDERVSWFLLEHCADACKYKIKMFLQEPAPDDWKDDIREFPQEKFAEAYARQAYGRCLLHVSPSAQKGESGMVCLSPDNCDSFVLNRSGCLMVRFDFQSVMEMSWEELLSADLEALRPRCQLLLKMAALREKGLHSTSIPWITREFVSGSEVELRRLTTIIAQTEPELFEKSAEPVTVIYQAETAVKLAHIMQIQRRGAGGYMEEYTAPLKRLRYLCALALHQNTFIGEDCRTRFDYGQQCGRVVYFAAWYGGFDKVVAKVEITVHPPSNHERAESLLSLSDWLEGKVSSPKRLRLLGLDEKR